MHNIGTELNRCAWLCARFQGNSREQDRQVPTLRDRLQPDRGIRLDLFGGRTLVIVAGETEMVTYCY